MNLQDVVRNQTRVVLDLLKENEAKLEDLLQQKRSADIREQKAKQEAEEIRSTGAERLEMVQALHIRVRELTKQVTELQERLRKRRKELQLAEDEQSKVERSYNKKKKEAARARKDAVEWARKVEQAHECQKQYEERLRRDRRDAFQKYLGELWTRIRHFDTDSQTSNEARSQLANLDRARHDDPEVAELWEARQEWQQIIQAAGPPRVRETASRELDRIEEELSQRFPGALTAAPVGGVLDELEEVFVYPRHTSGGYVLALPLPSEICHSLNAGETGKTEDLAVRVIWGFARGLPKKVEGDRASRPRFQIQHGFLVMVIDEELRSIQDRDPVSVTFPSGGRVSFLVSELPQAISGALCDENLNG